LATTPGSSTGTAANAAGAGAKAVKKSKPLFKRAWFRGVLILGGGAIAYSLIDRFYFHPHIENEVQLPAPVHMSEHAKT
jgi:hypothetical protein